MLSRMCKQELEDSWHNSKYLADCAAEAPVCWRIRGCINCKRKHGSKDPTVRLSALESSDVTLHLSQDEFSPGIRSRAVIADES